jgi:hypothetical protein
LLGQQGIQNIPKIFYTVNVPAWFRVQFFSGNVLFISRFIYVESAFFWRWWGEQDEQMKDVVRVLVNDGR